MITTLIILGWIALGLVNVYLNGVYDKKKGLDGWCSHDNDLCCFMVIVSPIYFVALILSLLPKIDLFKKIYNMGNKK